MSAFECGGPTVHRLCCHAAIFTATALLAFAMTGPAAVADQHGACAIWTGEEQPSPTVMEIRLNGDVGETMAQQLFAELDDHLTTYPTLKTVKILLSSTGGELESGFMIHNYLQGLHQRHALQVITHNVGSVQSAAVDIYCAGNQRLTSPYTYFMVHDSHFELGEGSYDIEDVRDLDEENMVTSDAGHALFSACTNLTVEDVDQMFADQTFIDPDRALELGLAHSIQPATYDRGADIRCLIDVGDEE